MESAKESNSHAAYATTPHHPLILILNSIEPKNQKGGTRVSMLIGRYPNN